MRNFAVRLLTLSMLTTSLSVAPIVTQVNAATTHGKHMKKRVGAVHQNPKADPSANPFASKYEDDFDRKNGGGGGY